MVIAEATASRDRKVVSKTATFAYPAELSLEQPTELGAALRKFLKENDFGASRAVVGLPARWLMAREKQVPPSPRDVAEGVLRIAAERQFASESAALVFDYAGTPDAHKQTTLLLLAAGKQHMDRVTTVITAAGVKVTAVTSSTLALGTAMHQPGRGSMILTLGAEAAELAVYAGDGPRSLRHLPVGGQQLASSNGTAAVALSTLGGEIMRTAATGTAENLTIWDGVGMSEATEKTLESKAGMQVATARDLSRIGASIEAPAGNDAKYGAAAALALAAGHPAKLPVNFLKSRLAPPKERRFGSAMIWGAAAVIVVLALGTWLVVDLHQRQAEVDDMEAKLDELKPRVKTAEAQVAKTEIARGWFDERTPVLDCMKYVTSAFPTDGSVIATSFSLRDNGKGLLAGKAPDQRSILAILDRLKGDKRFVDVTLMDMRDAGGNSRDVVFTVTFTYVGGT
jgi:hypothetical protein